MKRVYLFGEGSKEQKNLLGGKGANLSEMTNIGIPVPYGFTVTTDMCTQFYADGEMLSEALVKDIEKAIKTTEKKTGKTLGGENPLLLSVRSGARISMPGMMDTILNLGLNDEVAATMIAKTNNARFVYDIYRRFIQMFANVVREIDMHKFESILDAAKEAKGYKLDLELTAEDFKTIIVDFKKVYKDELGEDFPTDPMIQLNDAIEAVFKSWNVPRAIYYRNLNGIDHSFGTAVNIQEMVFGNTGDTSGTGVVFTRDPATGENSIYGEYLFNAQGEDIVAGIRTPLKIAELEEKLPEQYGELIRILNQLEKHYKDMQDVEITVEDGKLYILQTRNGKRTAQAAVQIATDMVEEKLLDKEEAVASIDVKALDALLHPIFETKALESANEVAQGLAASPGAASGHIVFASEGIADKVEKYGNVLLIRKETSPEDIEGMNLASGFATKLGGMTSHAAVVARGMGKCCVSGCSALNIDEKAGTLTINGKVFKEGDFLSLDGTTGKIYEGDVQTQPAVVSGAFEQILAWSKEIKKLGVKANADNERDSKTAIAFGAEGVGLCRTEHMFFSEERLVSVRKMIISQTVAEREAALAEILPYQLQDFKEMFTVMAGLPVTVRLLDPPLHEFLPALDEVKEVAPKLGVKAAELTEIIHSLHEFNPMLGHRGCRLGVTYPEITVMQTKAIIQAAIDVTKEGKVVKPEIMIPLVSTIGEFTMLKAIVKETADALIAASGINVDYKVGTMIETPRAAITAAAIAKEADFFSYGTNDLTQMTFGFSRDDAGKFIKEYLDKGIFEEDPFVSIDQDGVGALVASATKDGKKVNKDIVIGICGEHGGEPKSVEFFHNAGLNYVSCSPFRVPLAIVAAAQAAIKK